MIPIMSGSPPESVPPSAPGSLFPSTHWSAVLAAGGSGSSLARTAWDRLAQAYWQPLYNHARRRGRNHEDAQDLVQGFFARLIDKAALRQATPERGRFRSFLLASFEHFLANDHDHRHALKRGGGVEFIPLPDAGGELPAAASGEELGRAFDRDWAQSILSRAVERLEQEFAAEGKSSQYGLLRPFLFRSPDPGGYDRAAETLGLRGSQMPKLVFRFRQRLRALVRDEMARTVCTPPELEAEWRYLIALIADGEP